MNKAHTLQLISENIKPTITRKEQQAIAANATRPQLEKCYHTLRVVCRSLEYSWGGEGQMPPEIRTYYCTMNRTLRKIEPNYPL